MSGRDEQVQGTPGLRWGGDGALQPRSPADRPAAGPPGHQGLRAPAGDLHLPAGTTLATPMRRLAAHFLDQGIMLGSALAGALVVEALPSNPAMGFLVLPLVLGWFIWFWVTSLTGQTPAKRLLNLYIVRSDGNPTNRPYTWLRDLGAKQALFGVLSLVTFGLATALAAAWLLWDGERQAIWDKLTGTYVVYSPSGSLPGAEEDAQRPDQASR